MIGVPQLLMIFLIGCAISVSITRDLLTSIIIYMSYSMAMCIVWIALESPDLAITEAAVGTGITSLLYFLTLKKIHAIDAQNKVKKQPANSVEASETSADIQTVEISTAVASEEGEKDGE